MPLCQVTPGHSSAVLGHHLPHVSRNAGQSSSARAIFVRSGFKRATLKHG